jgi:hypothetical protein
MPHIFDQSLRRRFCSAIQTDRKIKQPASQQTFKPDATYDFPPIPYNRIGLQQISFRHFFSVSIV